MNIFFSMEEDFLEKIISMFAASESWWTENAKIVSNIYRSRFLISKFAKSSSLNSFIEGSTDCFVDDEDYSMEESRILIFLPEFWLSEKYKQEAHSHWNIFRQGGTEMIDWTYNNWF